MRTFTYICSAFFAVAACGTGIFEAPTSPPEDGESRDTTPPTVSMTSPQDGASIDSAQTLTLAATASDDTAVARVDFYDGSRLVGTAAAAPYTASWVATRAENGSHAFRAQAFDTAGNNATSAIVTLTVAIPSSSDTEPPTAAIDAPGADTIYTQAATVSIDASAADNVGVTRLELFRGATLITSVSGSSLSYDWTFGSADNGSHVFTATAFDAAGNSATSEARTLTVNIVVDNTPPAVAITSPAPTTYTTPQTVTLEATASDNIGVVRVEFYDGATLVRTDTTSPFTYAWTFTAADNGDHSFTARAFDAAGNNTTSQAVVFTVDVPVPGSAVLTWDANTEPDLAGYRVYHGTSPGTYGPPLSAGNTTTFTLNNLAAGTTHYFAVTAYDTSGNESAKSSEVSKAIP